jgi:hypothetical protein
MMLTRAREQDLGLEAFKQAQFGRSMRGLRWARLLALLAALPPYYRHFRGDFLLGMHFLQQAPVIPRQLRWCARCPRSLNTVVFFFSLPQHAAAGRMPLLAPACAPGSRPAAGSGHACQMICRNCHVWARGQTGRLCAEGLADEHIVPHARLKDPCMHACRYFQASGMRRRSLLFRLNVLALAAAFLATHLGAPLWVLQGELLRCPLPAACRTMLPQGFPSSFVLPSCGRAGVLDEVMLLEQAGLLPTLAAWVKCERLACMCAQAADQGPGGHRCIHSWQHGLAGVPADQTGPQTSSVAEEGCLTCSA